MEADVYGFVGVVMKQAVEYNGFTAYTCDIRNEAQVREVGVISPLVSVVECVFDIDHLYCPFPQCPSLSAPPHPCSHTPHPHTPLLTPFPPLSPLLPSFPIFLYLLTITSLHIFPLALPTEEDKVSRGSHLPLCQVAGRWPPSRLHPHPGPYG